MNSRSLLGPDDALAWLDGCHALVYELLNSFSLVRLGRVDVALGVRRDAVHGEPLAGLASAVAELGDDVQRLPVHHVDALVLAVGEEDVLLLRILREGDVPHRSVALRRGLDDLLLHELAALLEDLDAVVHAVADVEESIDRRLGAVHGIAKLRLRLARLVRR